MSFRVVILRVAERDLESIYDFIAAQDGDAVALRIVAGIEERCRTLAEFPERGNVPKELQHRKRRTYRELHYKPYRIIYRVAGDDVIVSLIADGRREMQRLFKERLRR
ncbi:toxin ParE3 [Variibacter gotjawalensis]|uniref:Toxin ParE3 n=1 Tax=Variibacter gotjawalensis TaxID=1333996 RepID=A0A0S3PR89_9BRAD|nr:type II toxin-antitoxin system RelE/ParE family toxin [Variibacter gotjawalensis]NIK48743.1 toxin ParE1/3/4 [Variibacter gotjawalensis]RZS50604.1 toxin ParE1/3/4 [Variibacter gotjawalensis]BAT58438.1 toxin ParE3 [Variibacter gotjawalensis]